MRRALPLLALALVGCHKLARPYHADEGHFTATFPGHPQRSVSDDKNTTSWSTVDLDDTQFDVSISKLDATTLSKRIVGEVIL